MELCKEKKLDWVEDPTNSSPVFWRNTIRLFLNDNPQLYQGLTDIVKTCNGAKTEMLQQGNLFYDPLSKFVNNLFRFV